MKGKKLTGPQLSMLLDVARDGYVHGPRGARGTPRLVAMGLIERDEGTGLYKLTEAGREAVGGSAV